MPIPEMTAHVILILNFSFMLFEIISFTTSFVISTPLLKITFARILIVIRPLSLRK